MKRESELVRAEVEILAALVVGLARRSGCAPETVLDSIAQHLDGERAPARLHVVSEDPQAAA